MCEVFNLERSSEWTHLEDKKEDLTLLIVIYNVFFLSKRLVLQYDVLDNENKGGMLKRKVKVLQYDVLDNEAKEEC